MCVFGWAESETGGDSLWAHSLKTAHRDVSFKVNTARPARPWSGREDSGLGVRITAEVIGTQNKNQITQGRDGEQRP